MRNYSVFFIMFLLGISFSVKVVNSETINENNNFGRFDHLKGKILLQVEQNGEAWYINPADAKRYYMGRPTDAFELMRNLGVGITNTNLRRIQVADANLMSSRVDTDGDGLSDAVEAALGTDPNKKDTDGDGYDDKTEILHGFNPLGPGRLPIDPDFARSQAGKILLQVEQNGEAWYINPDDNKRYYMGRPRDAFELMRSLGLGITDHDLRQISVKDNSKDLDSDEENGDNKSGDSVPLVFELKAETDKNSYKSREELRLFINLESNLGLDSVTVKAFGITNRLDFNYFNKTRIVELKKGQAEKVIINSTLPTCSACAGISPGIYVIDIIAFYEDEEIGRDKVSFSLDQ